MTILELTLQKLSSAQQLRLLSLSLVHLSSFFRSTQLVAKNAFLKEDTVEEEQLFFHVCTMYITMLDWTLMPKGAGKIEKY